MKITRFKENIVELCMPSKLKVHANADIAVPYSSDRIVHTERIHKKNKPGHVTGVQAGNETNKIENTPPLSRLGSQNVGVMFMNIQLVTVKIISILYIHFLFTSIKCQ